MFNAITFLNTALAAVTSTPTRIAQAVRVALKTELLEEDVRFALARLATLHPERGRYLKMVQTLDSNDSSLDQ